MQRLSRKAWVALSALWVGCSLVTDFDRNKIPEGIYDGGADAGMDGSVDAAVDAAPDASTDGDSGPITDTGPTNDTGPSQECTNDSECTDSQLCCDGLCVATSEARCSACDVGCAPEGNACDQRTCVCGTGAACSGQAPYCNSVSAGASSCVECRDATDCEGRTDGKLQCVGGSCVACDPSDNSGCEGNTPICNSTTFTCEGCTVSPDNCPGNTVCTGNGPCGGCGANDVADCTTPTTPICDLTANPTVCRGCASDAECMEERSLPYCINNQRCSACKPVTNQADPGCDINSMAPVCRINNASGQYECQGCQDSDQCTNAGPRDLCEPPALFRSRRCVECNGDNDCMDPTKPYCDGTGTCQPCGSTTNGDTFCQVNSPTRPLCDTSGACVACRNNGDCGAATPICDSTSHQCRGCSPASEAADCPLAANPACNVTTGLCAPCRPGGTRSACMAPADTCSSSYTCVDCEGTTGCTAGQTCTNNQCVCTSDAGCTSGHCDTATGMCWPCVKDGDCATDAAPLCNTATHACVACTPTTDDARCAAKLGSGICTTAGVCRECDLTDHRGCGNGKLCCGAGAAATCTATSDSSCTACNTPCGTNLVCKTGETTCVDCNSPTDCMDTAQTPYCTNNSCVACSTDVQCDQLIAGSVCKQDGSCGAIVACVGGAAGDAACASADSNHPVCSMMVCTCATPGGGACAP